MLNAVKHPDHVREILRFTQNGKWVKLCKQSTTQARRNLLMYCCSFWPPKSFRVSAGVNGYVFSASKNPCNC